MQRRVAGPSRHTGAQTERKRKPGARVTAKGKFKGEGIALNAGISDEEQKKKIVRDALAILLIAAICSKDSKEVKEKVDVERAGIVIFRIP